MKTKNSIAQAMYGCDFDELYGGEKASVTKRYNKQPTTRKRAPAGSVKATIGRVGKNGTSTCLLAKGATVGDLVEQGGYEFNESKEGIVAQSTGNSVDLDDVLVHNETYAIAPEIESN